MPERLVTIADACVLLGISERSLRRLLRAPEMAAKLQAEYRQTRTGSRRASLLSLDFVDEISQTLRHDAVNYAGNYTGGTLADMISHYEQVLAEKDARIRELTAALEHERAQSMRHAEAHARAQALIKPPSSPIASLINHLSKRRK